MNKSDLITSLSVKESLTGENASKIIHLIFDSFNETLKDGGRIEIRGFGAFSVRKYDGYTGRNPRTGKRVEVEKKRLPFFKVGKELKERVDRG